MNENWVTSKEAEEAGKKGHRVRGDLFDQNREFIFFRDEEWYWNNGRHRADPPTSGSWVSTKWLILPLVSEEAPAVAPQTTPPLSPELAIQALEEFRVTVRAKANQAIYDIRKQATLDDEALDKAIELLKGHVPK